MQEQLLNVPSWRGFNNPWMAEDEHDIEFSYINLMDNPERYTGYKVHHYCLQCLLISHVLYLKTVWKFCFQQYISSNSITVAHMHADRFLIRWSLMTVR